MKNGKLGKAKDAKFDEFSTQYSDIQREVNAYIEFNPDVFKGKPSCCLVTILNGVTSPNSL